MMPFSMGSVKIVLVLIVLTSGFYFWDFLFHPILNIILKSGLLGLIYIVLIYKLNISEDISNQMKKYLRLK